MTDILKTYGNYEVKITKNYPISTSEAWFTVEELAAAIEARVLAKLEQQRADEWGRQLCPTYQSSHTK